MGAFVIEITPKTGPKGLKKMETHRLIKSGDGLTRTLSHESILNLTADDHGFSVLDPEPLRGKFSAVANSNPLHAVSNDREREFWVIPLHNPIPDISKGAQMLIFDEIKSPSNEPAKKAAIRDIAERLYHGYR